MLCFGLLPVFTSLCCSVLCRVFLVSLLGLLFVPVFLLGLLLVWVAFSCLDVLGGGRTVKCEGPVRGVSVGHTPSI